MDDVTVDGFVPSARLSISAANMAIRQAAFRFVAPPPEKFTVHFQPVPSSMVVKAGVNVNVFVMLKLNAVDTFGKYM